MRDATDTDELKRKAAAGDPAAVRELITALAVERDQARYRAGVHPRGIA